MASAPKVSAPKASATNNMASATKLWNALPTDVYNAKNVDCFKRFLTVRSMKLNHSQEFFMSANWE